MSIVEFMQAAKKAITTSVTFPEVLCHTKDYDEQYTKEQLVEYGIQCAAKAVLVERERCAVICEKEYDNWDNERPLRICATLIRKGD